MPGDLLGRVSGACRVLGWGMMPLGAQASGFVAHLAGLRAPSQQTGGPLESAAAVREN